jgi:formylglycine-generating enzyme required for sulfatase activity
MTYFARILLFVLLTCAIGSPPAMSAQQRIALVIGNSAYANAPLANPVNDAQLISQALRQHGFDVIEKLDVGEREMGRAVKAFGERLKTAGSDAVGLFYYAGHGVQVGGINYLIPVDAAIEDEEDVPIEAVSADHILGIIEVSGNRLNLMFLDACRNNPFLRTSRNARHGLAMMNAPAGIFIGYATAPGDVAKDGSGVNSPFTTAMAATMGQPGEPIESMFKRVRLSVIAATEGEQTPWSASSLTGDFSFVPGAAVVTPLLPIVPADQPTRGMVRQAQEMLAALGYDPGPIDGDMGRRTTAAVIAFQQSKDLPVDGLVSDVLLQHLLGSDSPAPATDPSLAVWDRIAGSNRAADFERFLAQYPNSPLARSARDRLAELRRVAVVIPPAAPEPETPSYRAGETFQDCSACPEMMVVPAGDFQMGSTNADIHQVAIDGGRRKRLTRELPRHHVSVEQAFAVGKYEVTFAEWDACVSAGGCRSPDDAGWGRDSRPVINVSWHDAQEYVRWLSHETGHEYRFLSEAEWEYAARAGTQTARYWGDEIGHNNANCERCGSRWDDEQTAPVGSFSLNGFGLHDMLGNVSEWTQDCWHRNYSGAPSHAVAWSGSSTCERVLRGGSWNVYPRYVRSAYRYKWTPGFYYNDIGFRVSRTLF